MAKNVYVYGYVEHVCVNTNRAYLRLKAYKKVRNRKVETTSKMVEVHFIENNFKRNRKELMTLVSGDKVEVTVQKNDDNEPNYIIINQTARKDCTPITSLL